MRQHFRVLKNRNYAFYFFGQSLSMIGSWMQMMVQSWLIYSLSHSSVWLGAIAFCGQAPSFLMSPIAGAVADQFDRKRILVVVEAFGMLQAVLMAYLFFSHHLTLWVIAALAALLGVINAFEVTTRQAFTIDMVGKEDRPSAIALNSLIMNGARIFGPAIGGLLIGFVGEGWCFVLNGISYVAVIIGLVLMKTLKHVRRPSEANVITQIKEAVVYLRRTPQISSFLWFAGVVALIGFPYSVLLPVVAKDILHGGSHTLGMLTSANGVGAVIGGLAATYSDDFKTLRRGLFLRVVYLGLSLVVLGFSHYLLLSLAALFSAGYFMMGIFPLVNNHIQFHVIDSMRGRVMSLYTMTFQGTAPVAAVVAGTLAASLGTPVILVSSGLVCLGYSLGNLMIQSRDL